MIIKTLQTITFKSIRTLPPVIGIMITTIIITTIIITTIVKALAIVTMTTI